MGLPGGFERPREEWLTMLLEPLRGAGITLETLKLGPQELPLPDVPFADGVFPTPDGKMRISGEYRPPVEGIADGTPDETYPLQLISPHSAYRINSQFDGLTGQYALEHTRQLASFTAKNEAAAADRVAFSGADRFSERTEENLPGPLVRISDALRQRLGLTFGDYVRVSTARGHLIGRLGEATAQRDDVVAIEQGGTQVNLLTRQGVSEIGLTTAFYDCRCRIDPA
jgi:anaerobic selenocysteine-containing dehydrogenase